MPDLGGPATEDVRLKRRRQVFELDRLKHEASRSVLEEGCQRVACLFEERFHASAKASLRHLREHIRCRWSTKLASTQ